MSAKRLTPRARTRQRAAIMTSGPTFGCVVVDLSTAGARLEVTDQTVIPDRFDLFIGAERPMTSCVVVWRRDLQIGVRFV
ncbi:MAG: PilZ domain-containing protein [Alsobacter sp.]